MFHSAIHLLTIACLLVCPVRCLAEKANVSHGPIAIANTCGGCCCGGAKVVDPPLSPTDCPHDGCDCGNCICDGAVIGSVKIVLLSPQLCLDFDFARTLIARPTYIVSQRYCDCATVDRQPYPCGRDARIAQHSLLI